MARFKSFDMTGMTQVNSINQQSPNNYKYSKDAPIPIPQPKPMGGESQPVFHKKVNVVTKLPIIELNNVRELTEENTTLNYANDQFTVKEKKDFIAKNIKNAPSHPKLGTNVSGSMTSSPEGNMVGNF